MKGWAFWSSIYTASCVLFIDRGAGANQASRDANQLVSGGTPHRNIRAVGDPVRRRMGPTFYGRIRIALVDSRIDGEYSLLFASTYA